MAKLLRRVTLARIREGRVGLLGPDTGRRRRWWELTLECGHIVERYCTYVRGAPFGVRDVRPAPQRARCDLCAPVANPPAVA